MRYEEVPWILANCAGTDPEVWFPEGTNPTRDGAIITRVCERCDIRAECLAWAIENDEVGYWGGEYFATRRRDDDEYSEPVHAGDNGGGVLEVRCESPGEMPPVVGDAPGFDTDSASCRAEESGVL